MVQERMQKVRDAVVRRIARPIYHAVLATTGRRLATAVHFRSLEAFGGQFDADAEAARRVMARPELDVVEHEPGRTSVRVMALDYHDVDLLARYREVAIALPVRYRDADHDDEEGSFVLQMPVTSEEARWGGVEVYGFPKFVAAIELARDGRTRVATVRAGGAHVLTLRVDSLESAQGQASFHNYTVRGDHQLVESRFDLDGRARARRGPRDAGARDASDRRRASPDGHRDPRSHRVLRAVCERRAEPRPRGRPRGARRAGDASAIDGGRARVSASAGPALVVLTATRDGPEVVAHRLPLHARSAPELS